MSFWADGVVRRARELADGAQELVWPTRCLGCDLPGELLCEDCRATLPWIAQRWACPVCGAPYGWITCTECDRAWETRCCVAALTFRGTAARMATALKDAHELRLAPVIASAIEVALDEASSWDATDGLPRFSVGRMDAVSFVPATPEAYKRRGFDHMELVSRELSRATGLPLADVLVRARGRDQRVLGRQERASNLEGSICAVEDVSGMRILLADDVVTTGATMREAARALLDRGAESVTACALARVW